MVDPLLRVILDAHTKPHRGGGRVITYEGFVEAMKAIAKQRNHALKTILKDDPEIDFHGTFRDSLNKLKK